MRNRRNEVGCFVLGLILGMFVIAKISTAYFEEHRYCPYCGAEIMKEVRK